MSASTGTAVTAVTMPVLGLTMEEGTVAEWLKREGDAVARDEPLLMVEMDKGTIEVPSPAAGVLRRIVVQPGTTVAVRTLIAEIGASDAETHAGAVGRVFASPRARMRARALGVTLSGLHGTGPHGRIVEADVVAAGPRTLAGSATGADVSTNVIAPTAAPATVDADSPTIAGAPAVVETVTGSDLPTLTEMALSAEVSSGAAAPMAAEAMAGADSPTIAGARASVETVTGSDLPTLTEMALSVDVSSGAAAPMAAEAMAGAGTPSVAAGVPSVVGTATEADAPVGASARVSATPLARRLADEHGVSLDEIRGTGPGGRVTHDDVLRAARGPAGTVQADVQPLSRVRRITAERLAESARATARVTLFLDADFSEAARFRRQLDPEFARLGVAKLPWDAIIARAAGLALSEHRGLLAQWVEGEGLRASTSVNVGVAVSLEPEGLVVPVLHDADRRSLRELAGDLLALVERARAGRLSPDAMQGGSFSITNLGAYRVDGFTPIVNPPETAILGVGRIADKPVVIDGEVVVRTMCTLSLSFDHRVIDGAPAAAFLARLAELLERPYALLGI